MQLNELIDEILDFARYDVDFQRLDLNTDYAVDLPLVLADPKKLRQVVMNLIMNARHAIGDDGSIHVSTAFEQHKKEVWITIRDTGQGIEKKNLSKIFDPFFTTKPTGEGTGLGLSVSYGIIKSHGGDIFVNSALGKGSVFTVTLPAQLDP